MVKKGYESPEGTWRFSIKPLVNRYMELCNPFPRIIDSFPQIGNRYFKLDNPFLRFRQFVLSNCNSISRIRQSSRSLGLQLLKSRERIAIRENGLSNSNERILVRENGLLF